VQGDVALHLEVSEFVVNDSSAVFSVPVSTCNAKIIINETCQEIELPETLKTAKEKKN
jgi:hypothetical protein